MTVNRTTLLDLPLPVTGTESGTWGDTTNNGLSQYMDIAIAGMNSLTSANFTAGALTIANTQGDSSATNIAAGSAQYATIRVSSLAVNSTITAPSSNRSYRIINADATYSLTIKASGQTGVTFLPGQTGVVAFNGTDYVIVGVVGAGTATDNAVARFDGTTGEIIQNSGVTIDDSNNVSGVAQLNITTLDATNIEVTNIKAKDGTAAGSIADSTGVVTLGSSVLTTTDINGGTIDGTTIGGSTAAAGSFTTLNTSGQVVFNDAGANVDFRVEGDTEANLLFVDASADAVGIGTTSIAKKLTVNANQNGIRLAHDFTTNDYAELSFSSIGVAGNGAAIRSFRSSLNFNGNEGDLRFFTNTGSGGASSDGLERARITSAGQFQWSPDGTTQAMTLDASGNLLVGTTNPAISGRVSVSGDYYGVGEIGAYDASKQMIRTRMDSGVARLEATFFSGSGGGYIPLAFSTSDAERARITSTGETQAVSAGDFGIAYGVTAAAGTTKATFVGRHSSTAGSTGTGTDSFIVWSNGDVINTNNSYGQISDIKIKQDIVDAASQWEDIKGVKVRKFRFKNDPTAPLQLGVVAQELEQVSPGLINESPDYEEVEATDEEGNVKTERQLTGTSTKSVKYSVLYMKAIKALQEAMTRIEQLEAKVSALEGTQP